jgi:hypothetical protein
MTLDAEPEINGVIMERNMNTRRRRTLLLSVAMVSVVSTTAWGQAAPPDAVAAAGGAPSGATPDFSGVWAHPYLTGFEPPASGPGPVLNRSRRPDGVANFQQLVGDFANPILQRRAADVVKKHGEVSLAGNGYPTPSNQCWPGGVPYVFWDFLVQIFQRPDRILMIYRQGPEMRHVRMNADHPAQVTPSWYGDSVGHYEDDTLVIDTVGIKIGPFAMRHVRHPAQRGAACRRALPPRRLRWSQGRLGAQRQGERLHPGHCGDGCRGDRSQPPRQGAAAPLHRRRCGRLHHAVDGNHHLSAESGAVEQGGLCRKPPMVSRDIFRRPARGQAGFSKSILLDGKVISILSLITFNKSPSRYFYPRSYSRQRDSSQCWIATA